MIGTVARELAALAAGDAGQREVASLALRLLYLEHRRLGSGRVRLRRIEIAQFRKLTGPVVLDGLGDGLIVVSGDNEEGKSTVLAALKAAFFEHHAAGGAVREAMAPHRGGVPEIAVEFECGGAAIPAAQGVPACGRRAGDAKASGCRTTPPSAACRNCCASSAGRRAAPGRENAGRAGPVLGRPGDRVPRLRERRRWP